MAIGQAPLGATLYPPRRTQTRVALVLWPLLVTCYHSVSAQELPISGVNGYSLHPPYFNLAESTKITATATCGEDDTGRTVRDLYCKLVGGPVSGDPSQTIQGQYCDICSQGDSDRAHPITNAIDGTERWWQSPPLSRSTEYNEVNVTLDLGQLFHVAYVLIKFANSPRPDLWVLERSIDFGQTYQPWQYFASSKRDCIELFGQRTIERINNDDDIICTTEYSRIVPLENGEIVVSLVNGRPGAMNFSYSPVLREFTKATNIRLRFLRTNTLLGHLMGKALRDPTVTRRYYYSIKDISIGGRCVCNGHAEACNAKDPSDPYKLQCDCQHNTCGVSCDQCCPGYNQLPWKPATTYSANECEPCNCHRHSFDCYYDPEVDQKGGSMDIHGEHRGGGVCLNCQHHTTGVNCERCIPTHYRSPDHPIDSPLACSPCDCLSQFTDGTCEDLTGHCFCKPNYAGENCDSCASGFMNFPDCYRMLWCNRDTSHNGEAKPAGEFIMCGCSLVGSLPEGCDASGRCLCKPEFQGPRCEQCRSGYHSYPNCQGCQCSAEGSRYTTCDQVTGQCVCLPSVVGLRCDNCGECECRHHVEGPACDTCKPLYWNLSPDTPDGCSNCECNVAGTLSSVAECAQETGQCHCKPNVCSGTCSTCKDGYYNLQENNYLGCQGCLCNIGGSAGQSCGERHGRCRCRPNVEGPKYHYFPDLHHLKFEIEEGTMLDGRPVRFGYNPLEFTGFSWRGYAQMSPIQSKVLVSVSVSAPDLFRVVLRYANWGSSDVRGRLSVIEDSWNNYCSEQSKQIVFAPSVEPTFVNVPQNNFVEPFVLNPGTWNVVIEAEGILLDYLVLLPSAYYEAPILQIKVTEPCTYSSLHIYVTFDVNTCDVFNSPPNFSLFRKVYLHDSWCVKALRDYIVSLLFHKCYAVFYEFTVRALGHTNASFCPHAYGCRNILVSENQIILDVTDHEVFLTVQIPAGKKLWLDYVLVVPETSYSSSYLNEEPLDKSYDFISSCGQNSFYINPSTTSPFCLSSAVSLSAFFNNGAMPCACHEIGADSDTCELFGGQCRCRPNVIGRDCSMCATGYWGFPNCRACNCGTRLCEPVTGDCICPPRTVRPECTQCEPQTFGCHPVVGCEICNCSQPGISSTDVNCDTLSGQCRCKNNIVGRQCDRCAPGYYGYPNCRPCNCNEAGTEEAVCNSFTGQCLCKENVQGSRCDQCRVGTFHLDPTNPKGCTSCFCFGATDRCLSSDKRRTEIMDMEGWVLLGADRQEVAVTVYPGQDLVEADLSDVPDVYQDLHWYAPKIYLGDKVSSYGGYLRYRLQTQTMRGDVLPLPVEGSFRHAQTGNSVSREELMMVLVGLESLQIRALHSQSAHSVLLRGAVLEGAEILPIGRHANNVEICMCPANYLGDSCQKCAPGYYRDTIGLFLGKCVPCNCNGHSDHCLDGSGICVNCQHNTAGDHCERCQGGFLGNNSLDGQTVSCSSCPCPLRVPSNNFAEGCVQRDDRMQCLCMPGYAGPHCERCAPGFYGNPMVLGSRCQPCHCHGNTDPNMLFTDCHPLTGDCQSCMHNTAGPHCDTCAPGHYGDAITARNCTSKLSSNLQSCISTAPSLLQESNILKIRCSCSLCCLLVLDRVNEELANHQRENNDLAKAIRERLIRFHSEMMDLRDALNEAVNNTARAAEINNVNQKTLEDNKEYERLAAQLDGARTPLIKKVQNFAGADSKIPLVEAAEKHAEMLDALARNLSSQEISEAKQAAGLANTTATQVNDALRPIKEQLDQWQQAYGDANITSYDINKALMEANKTVHELGTSIPALLTKLDHLQSQSVQMPNISENISRIRQLIQQARNAASKVSVPVKFNGTSSVQVRLSPNLADLAAYTSLKFYITLPAQDMQQSNDTQQFIFYLGNKDVSITTLRQGPFCFVFLLHVCSHVPSYSVCPIHFVCLTQYRILQYGQMSMSSEATEGDQRVTKAYVEAQGDQGLLNLLSDDTVFYVGGYPSMFTPPAQLALPNFKGCVELDTLNEDVISLYNFENIFSLNTTEEKPCGRWAWVNDAAYFDGTGFAEITFTDESDRMQRFEQEVKLVSHKGILLLLQNKVVFTHLCYYMLFIILIIYSPVSYIFKIYINFKYQPHISMAVRINSSNGLVLHMGGSRHGGAVMSLMLLDGHLQLLVDGGKRKASLRTRKKYNDNQWHTVFVKREGEMISLIVDGIGTQSKKIPGGDRTRLTGSLYVGGVPPSLMVKPDDVFQTAVRLQKHFLYPAYSQGTVPCFQNPLQPGAYFSGQGGYMTIGCYCQALDMSCLRPVVLLEVRPILGSGMLLHAGTSSYHQLNLFLRQGEVTFSVNSGKGEFSTSFTPEESLCNGHWHTITGGFKSNCPLNFVPARLPAFHGCIRQATVNRRPATLSKPFGVHGAVGTQGCPY
uniref:Laminin, alpha 5 n=1 Tax=Mastacembelus armatus TaxID=205130 RepID=A0A7N8WL84_9TELE